MKTFEFRVAMDVRAYGTVSVNGDTVEAAKASLTAKCVADKFVPHGSNEDIDFQHPSEIWIESAKEQWTGVETMIDDTVPDGDWIQKRRIWTVTINDDSGVPDASVHESLEDAEEKANDWIEDYWQESEGAQLFPLITSFAAKYEWLCNNESRFMDSCVITTHELS